LLKNTKGLQYLVNERLATRPGLIGRIFKGLEMGKREYSEHTLHRAFRLANFFWVSIFRVYAYMRPVGSRFFGAGNGPLNYPGLFCYFWATAMIFARCRFQNARDQIQFNSQDGVQFWFDRYNMMFPPNFLHNRISAHYIEINNIFFAEMLKKYVVARKEILAERDLSSLEEHRTKYVTNANYIYEPLKKDTDTIKRLRADGHF
jgi:hypothetical protein